MLFLILYLARDPIHQDYFDTSLEVQLPSRWKHICMNAGCEEERDENTQLCPDCRTNTMPDTTPLVSPRDMYPDNPVSAAAVMHDLFTEASLAGLRGTPLPELNPNAGVRGAPAYHGP